MSDLLRIGVDVGGTNTDAVLLRGREVLASHKAPTTSDVGGGIIAAISQVLTSSRVPAQSIVAVMIGTTHFTNALIEARHLCVEMRGVKKPGALTVTSAIRGIFHQRSQREEFLDLLRRP